MKQEGNGCGKAYKTKKQVANYPVQSLTSKGKRYTWSTTTLLLQQLGKVPRDPIGIVVLGAT
jgi:hypothetical protein